MKRKIVAVVPARLGSKRFEGKVLHLFQGKPLLYYVWKSLSKSNQIDRVIIATDDKKIKSTAEEFGAEVVVTSRRHKTGSDRLAEVAKKVKADCYLNVQADNFGIKAKVLDRYIDQFCNDKKSDYGTLIKQIKDEDQLFNPNTVKVVGNEKAEAIWFSRYPLPYLQNYSTGNRTDQHKFYSHIGIYFFTRAGILKFAKWGQSENEKAESLEQLRIIENGNVLKLYKTRMETVSIDTVQDLKKINKI